MQVIEEEGIQSNAGRIGDLFITELMKLRDEFEVVGDVRGKGLMLGAELVKSKVRERER
jgi:alanine-glyoxylate transaminase/(R)-3-amino-2-methylpropionate-pyruvate transaminase